MKKFLIILSLITAVCGMVFFFFVSYMQGKYEEVNEQAKTYAVDTNKEGCVENFIQSYKRCEDVSCYAKVGMFGGICVAAAKGDINQLCSEALSTQVVVTQCQEHSFNETDCNSLFQFYNVICESGR